MYAIRTRHLNLYTFRVLESGCIVGARTRGVETFRGGTEPTLTLTKQQYCASNVVEYLSDCAASITAVVRVVFDSVSPLRNRKSRREFHCPGVRIVNDTICFVASAHLKLAKNLALIRNGVFFPIIPPPLEYNSRPVLGGEYKPAHCASGSFVPWTAAPRDDVQCSARVRVSVRPRSVQ